MVVTATILNSLGFIALITSSVYVRKSYKAGEIAPPIYKKSYSFHQLALILYLAGYLLVSFYR